MRIILIDQYSGYIWGDSADLDGRIFDLDAALAINPDLDAHSEHDFAIAYAEALDRSIGGEPRSYVWGHERDGDSGYIAYRVDINGSEAVSVVQDGQDRETIEAVESDCRRISGKITWRAA